jgi:regulator of protease activity HflC (stomatin/prohibitin superfamily)
MDDVSPEFKFGVKVVFGLILLGVLFAMSPFAIIGTTERGVVLRWGVITRVMEPGIHWRTPIAEDVETVDVSVKALEVKELAYSKDGQTLEVSTTVNYQVDPLKVKELYGEVRNEVEERYVLPKTKNSLKTIMSRYTAQGIIEHRGEISGEIAKDLELALAGNWILVKTVSVTNYDFDDKYEAAISEKQVQEQNALAQVNITKQEEEKKKQEILKAEALSEKTRLEAAALASQNGEKVVAKIYAEAALEAARKWNGTTPTTVVTSGTDGSIPLYPFMELGK